MTIGPFNWRVRVLRASPGSVTTETTAHLCDDQGRARCGLVELTNTKPAAISATRCTVCADPGEPLDEQRLRLPDTRAFCEQRCGSYATVYAMDTGAGGWGGRYCEPCAKRLGFTITDRYPSVPAVAVADAMLRRMSPSEALDTDRECLADDTLEMGGDA